MTLAEKAGLMLIDTHTPIVNPTDGKYVKSDDPLWKDDAYKYSFGLSY